MLIRKPPKHTTTLPHKRTCCGVIEEASYKAREKKATRTKKQPWVVLKLMIAYTVGIMGYTAYVYIGRFCVKMIRERGRTGGSRGTGVGLLVVFSVILLWMLWAYLKVVLTPPGYAKDHIPKSSRPLYPEPIRPASWDTTNQDIESNINQHDRGDPSVSTGPTYDPNSSGGIGGPSYENIPMHPNWEQTGGAASNRQVDSWYTQEPSAGVITHPTATGSTAKSKEGSPSKDLKTFYPKVSRKPPTTPVLRPEQRYCTIDEIVKPYRTHHCRICGTCVLKYDHHCPWIGQCVGARNQKFFMNFIQAALVFTLYTFATLLAYTVVLSESLDGDIDPQEIVIIALAALFALFTGALLISHTNLIWNGQTTVESMHTRRLVDREARTLNEALGFCQILEKRRTRKRWDEEWGAIGREGNIWWLGSGKQGWVDVMGNSPWGWFLPIGRSLSDGLTYPVNPRFDEQGLWRRRVDWPPELR